MSISFQATTEYFTFHDPTQGGKCIDRPTEIRVDPLTNETSRIIFNPGSPFVPNEYERLATETAGPKCPFCPENVMSFTPTFPEPFIPNGRVIKNEAIAFPNLFPYSKHNAVVRMSKQHFVRLNEFSAPLIADAFETAAMYLQQVIHTDSDTKYASVSWNYLPPSGGSILHPHIHVLASEQPTNYQRKIEQQTLQFYSTTKEHYYEALLAKERELQERYIGVCGSIDWVHSYAPKTHADFLGITSLTSFQEIGNSFWNDFAESMLRYFSYFQSIGIASFNATIHIPLKPSTDRVHIRLLPRLTIGALQTSDMNVFNHLHEEPLCLLIPEETTKAVAPLFSGSLSNDVGEE